MYNTTYKIIGKNIKLLRSPVKLENTSFLELYNCFKDPENIDFDRFEALVEAGASINDPLPRGGGTLLHLCALALNRTCLRALIKRPDLDYLARDNEGFYPSMRAIDLDSGSSVARLLLIKERAAALKGGVDISLQMEEAWAHDINRRRIETNDPSPS